jgi:hypothetical protein
MKRMDYTVGLVNGKWTAEPISDRAKERTAESIKFPSKEEALAFVRAGVTDKFRFSGRELIDPEYRLVRYCYFVDRAGQLIKSGQDNGPPDPTFEVGDVYPGGPRDGMHFDIKAVLTGDSAKNLGCGVAVIGKERDVSKAN